MVITNKQKHFFLQATSSPDAWHNLGVIYHMGYVTNGQPDYQKAADFYQQAKTPISFCNLGKLYINGYVGKANGEPDYRTAIKYLELSGLPQALYSLGAIYMREQVSGVTSHPDYAKAKYYFEMAAKKGYADALPKLGFLYLSELPEKTNEGKDYQPAIDFFQKAIQSPTISSHAKAEAWYNLGVMHIKRYEGFGNNKPDYLQAQKCFEQAESPNSFLQLAYLYQTGNIQGQPDYQLSIAFFQKAVQSPNVSPSCKAQAYYGLGLLYLINYKELGYDQPAYLQAKEYFEKANLPASLYYLGEFYKEGYIGGQPDYNKALEYYSQSSLPHSKLCILILYLAERIQVDSHRRKKRIIQELIHEIDTLSAPLAAHERSYIQGMVAYLTSKWDNALILLQQALVGGYPDEANIRKILEEIHQYFESIKNENEGETKKDQGQPVKIQLQQSATVGEEFSTSQQASTIKFTFLDKKKEQQFLAFQEENGKVNELLKEIKACCWTTHGVGKPEVLKHTFKGYSGCLARRINQEDRLVYKAKGAGEVLILSWQGHYAK